MSRDYQVTLIRSKPILVFLWAWHHCIFTTMFSAKKCFTPLSNFSVKIPDIVLPMQNIFLWEIEREYQSFKKICAVSEFYILRNELQTPVATCYCTCANRQTTPLTKSTVLVGIYALPWVFFKSVNYVANQHRSVPVIGKSQIFYTNGFKSLFQIWFWNLKPVWPNY